MKHYFLTCLDYKVKVLIYSSQWHMHAASIEYKKRNCIQSTTHDAVGACYRWEILPLPKDKIVAIVFISWDLIDVPILMHELLHAAIHCWSYKEQGFDGKNYKYEKALTLDHEEELCHAQSDMFYELMELLTTKQQQILWERTIYPSR